MAEDVGRLDGRGGQGRFGSRTGQRQCGGHTSSWPMSMSVSNRSPVIRQSRGRQVHQIQSGSDHVLGWLAEHGFDPRTGAGLDGRNDGGTVGLTTAGDRAETVGVGGEEVRLGVADGVESDLQLAVHEGTVEAGDHCINVVRLLGQFEPATAQLRAQRLLTDDEQAGAA